MCIHTYNAYNIYAWDRALHVNISVYYFAHGINQFLIVC